MSALITEEEAAALLGVTLGTMGQIRHRRKSREARQARQIASGELSFPQPALPINGRYGIPWTKESGGVYFRLDDVREYRDNRKNPGGRNGGRQPNYYFYDLT